MAYTKLFASIITSTIWMEPDQTRIVWITMLAAADKNGEVQGSIPGLARIAGVPIEAAREAVAKFLAPDPDSRTKDDEGRRIEVIDGGWRLLNHRKYREMASRDEAREAEAKRKAAYRAKIARNAKESGTVPDKSQKVPFCLHIADADSEADTEDTNPLPPLQGELVQVEANPIPPEKPPLLRRVEKLFGRTDRRKLSAGEVRAWRVGKSVVAETTEDEWALLEWWFALPDLAPGVEYRRSDMAACLNNWHAEIAKARKNKGQAPAGTPVVRVAF